MVFTYQLLDMNLTRRLVQTHRFHHTNRPLHQRVSTLASKFAKKIWRNNILYK
jgi:hypothetical protein